MTNTDIDELIERFKKHRDYWDRAIEEGRGDVAGESALAIIGYIGPEMAQALQQQKQELEEAVEVIEKIDQWAKAYPLDIFPEPDFQKALELLKAGDITLDSISASCMRHVIKGVGEKTDAFLKKRGESDE